MTKRILENSSVSDTYDQVGLFATLEPRREAPSSAFRAGQSAPKIGTPPFTRALRIYQFRGENSGRLNADVLRLLGCLESGRYLVAA